MSMTTNDHWVHLSNDRDHKPTSLIFGVYMNRFLLFETEAKIVMYDVPFQTIRTIVPDRDTRCDQNREGTMLNGVVYVSGPILGLQHLSLGTMLKWEKANFNVELNPCAMVSTKNFVYVIDKDMTVYRYDPEADEITKISAEAFS